MLLLTLFVLQETWKRSPLSRSILNTALSWLSFGKRKLNSLPGAHKKEPPYVQIGITAQEKMRLYIVLDFAPKTGCHARFRFNVAGFVRPFNSSFFFFSLFSFECLMDYLKSVTVSTSKQM